MDAQLAGTIEKVDEERGRFYGWAYVISKDGQQIVDHSGDVIDTPEARTALEDAFTKYVTDHRSGDLDHSTFGVSKLIEAAFITKEKAELMGMTTDREGMWVGYEIDRSTEAGKKAWQLVKSGERAALSIVGRGKRVALA
jgi:putative serine protease XkdF